MPAAVGLAMTMPSPNVRGGQPMHERGQLVILARPQQKMYVPIIAQMGAKVIVQCQSQLRELFRGVKGIAQIISAGDRYPAFDTYAKLMSLPGMLRAKRGNIPADAVHRARPPSRSRMEAQNHPRRLQDRHSLTREPHLRQRQEQVDPAALF